MNHQDELKEANKTAQEWATLFKDPDSRKERVTHIYTHTVVWLLEDGKKVKELSNQKNSNTTTDILFHGTPKNFDDYTDHQAIKYAEDTILSYSEQMPESYGSEELFRKMIVNLLRTQILNYTSKYLEYLKKQEMNWCVKLADDLLKDLTPNLLDQYKESDEKQKKIFKERVEVRFPNSQILKEILTQEII